jgi:hypothetical protein
MPSSKELMEKFQNDYGFTKSFDELVNEGDVFLTKYRAVKRFGEKEPNITPEQKKYKNGLFYMLSIVIDEKINPSEQKNEYKLSDLNVAKFIDEYEKIMVAKNEESAFIRERAPYEGIGVDVMKMATRSMQAFNKPLASVWADRIRKEKFDVSKMRSLTDGIYQRVAENNNYINEGRSSVETAVIMHEALKGAINNRTIGMYFQPRNWWRFGKEYFYEKALAKQIKEYKKLDENIVTDTLRKYEEPMSNAHEALSTEKTKLENKEIEASAKKINNLTTKKELVKQIQKISGMSNEDIESVIDEAIDAANTVRQAKEGRDYVPPQDIENCAIKPFAAAFELLTDEYNFSKKDAAIKAQQITNILIKAYAPKEIIGEKIFERISDNSVVKNDFALQRALSNDPECKKLYNDLQKEYSKERLVLNLGDDHSNEQKSERVEYTKSYEKSISIN